MSTLLLWVGLALAGAREDLVAASNKSLDEAARMEAFDRLVTLGAMDMSVVMSVSADANADARQRWVAIRVLGKVGGPAAREQLLARLKDDMPAIRVAAASALGDLGDPMAVQPLIDTLEDPALLVRAASADALGQLGDRRAVSALAAQLTDRDGYHRGNSLWVRKHYAEALGHIGDKAALPALLVGLDDPDPSVAEASVRAMEEIAGFTFSEGRTAAEQKAAWKRWASTDIKNFR